MAKSFTRQDTVPGSSIQDSTPTTVFHVASVSKQFTCFAILQLDERLLSIDDDIRTHVPELNSFTHTITIRHLVHHTSGLRDQWTLLNIAGWRLDDVITKEHILEKPERIGYRPPLEQRPGSEFSVLSRPTPNAPRTRGSSKSSYRRSVLIPKALLFAICFIPISISASDWPQWRGSDMNGISSAKGLPATWSTDTNIVWKSDLPAWSGGTPVVFGDYIFLTSPSAPLKSKDPAEPAPEQTNRRRRGPARNPGGDDLLLMAFSRKNGSELWRKTVDQGNRLWRKQNNTSPSPVTDGKQVWVITGTGQVAAYTVKGEQVWTFNLQDTYGDFGLNWGYASSPLLYKDRLIIEILHGMHTDLPSYVTAYDKITGKRLWKQVRKTDALRESPDAYTTPVVLTHGGKDQIVISGGDYVTGHNPDTGAEIWRAAGLNPDKAGANRMCGSPVAVDGMIYATSRKKPILALKAGGTGDISESHLAWKWEGPGAPDVPSALTDGKYFYMVDDRGLISCLNAKTGDLVWGPQRTARGTVSSSLVQADGKLFILNEIGVTTVVAAGPEYKVLSTNELDGSYTLSSPVIAGDSIFIRTGKHLYRISKTSS
jgi:outer membrane protein assembly factor BamB